MTRLTHIQAKFLTRPKLKLPANKQFYRGLGKRFLKQLSLERGTRLRRFGWMKYYLPHSGLHFPASPFNWR